MEETSINSTKYIVIGLLILAIFMGLLFLPLGIGKAQNNQSITTLNNTKPAHFSDAITANTLCSAGLGDCSTVKAETEESKAEESLFGNIFNISSKIQADPVITVVNIPGQTAVYRIINGQKHSIPTTEIFESYGFGLEIVQEITSKELEKYPLARLFLIENDESQQIYYLTKSGMIRPVLNDEVFYSYGDRKEDVITINQKEFNYYPRNQFIFLERPKLNRDIYQITGGVKRYLTPVAVKRMDLKENEIAPVNQIEFNEYPEGEPIIF